MGANCASLLTDLFLHAYEADILQGVLKNKDRKLAHTFNSIFRYIDDVLSLNNYRFGYYLHHINQIKVKDTTDTEKIASYLDLHLEIDNAGRSKTKLYDKRDDITLPSSIAIFQHHQYGVYISQLIRYSRVYAQYSNLLDRIQLLTQTYSNKVTLLLG